MFCCRDVHCSSYPLTAPRLVNHMTAGPTHANDRGKLRMIAVTLQENHPWSVVQSAGEMHPWNWVAWSGNMSIRPSGRIAQLCWIDDLYLKCWCFIAAKLLRGYIEGTDGYTMFEHHFGSKRYDRRLRCLGRVPWAYKSWKRGLSSLLGAKGGSNIFYGENLWIIRVKLYGKNMEK